MKVLSSTYVVLVALLLLASGAKASEDLRAYDFGRPQTVEIPTPKSLSLPTKDCGAGVKPRIDISIDTIINTAKEIWAIVEANKPVVKMDTNFANAIPKGIDDWTQLECWSNPVVHTFRTTYTNGFGSKPVVFEYRVYFNYNGRKDGVGRYLNNVTIVPSNLSVGWGYKFNAEVIVPNIANTGTTANPVAGMVLQLNWTVETVLKSSHDSETFFVRGDGNFQKVAND